MVPSHQPIHPAVVTLGLVILLACVLGVLVFVRRQSPAQHSPLAAPSAAHALPKR